MISAERRVMTTFSHGPFFFSPGSPHRAAGINSHAWEMKYGNETLNVLSLPDSLSRDAITDAFEDARSAFVARQIDAYKPERISLIDFETDEEIGHFYSDGTFGMTLGLIDDRSRYWIRSADRLYSRDVTLTQFAALAAQHKIPDLAWVSELLPQSILSDDPPSWRAPTSWEIRHVVGEGSFSHVSGAKAAELVGISPQNFRKYTASDEAKNRQSISYAMWHLLLHKLGVKRA